MATSVTFNGTSYSIPGNREPRGWGTSLSAFLVDVAQSSLSKAGGNFTLTADTNFGSNYGLVLKYIKSVSSNIAASGVVRLANTDKIAFRNNVNGADLELGVSTSDRLQFGGVNVPTISSTDTLSGKTISALSNTLSDLTKTDVGLGNVDNTSDATKNAATATLTNKTFGDSVIFTNISTPATPSAGTGRLYFKSDKPTYLDSSGNERVIANTTDSLTNPMNTTGDTIYGGASGVATRLAGNTTTTKKYFTQTGNGSVSAAPVWNALATPTVQKFTSGSGTYTTPAGVAWIRVRMVGAGGGGGGSGTAGGSAGGTGGNTTFGSSLLVANGGSGGARWDGNAGGAGGSASLGTGPIGTALSGGYGGSGGYTGGTGSYTLGGMGGSSFFGGAGGNGVTGGQNGATNSGSGGGGAGTTGGAAASGGGGGGGSGGFVDAIIVSPSSSYAYSVGTAGTAGSAGTNGNAGGAGGSGYIEVTEFYQ